MRLKKRSKSLRLDDHRHVCGIYQRAGVFERIAFDENRVSDLP
jgi:hypothetical protein